MLDLIEEHGELGEEEQQSPSTGCDGQTTRSRDDQKGEKNKRAGSEPIFNGRSHCHVDEAELQRSICGSGVPCCWVDHVRSLRKGTERRSGWRP